MGFLFKTKVGGSQRLQPIIDACSVLMDIRALFQNHLGNT